ncbi:hypothetical protein NDU88_005248 [Pleurodeles waltl]|uniref:Myb/SANT-like DNA-binding domain-containing protein n=1 Tax=Pleurodeles waltl TaxID=8319 RepID=A0AAV7UI80_PLEWA|nr:hypothetical protein NDU88_005248 [Pleurodeles waltl]
MAPQRHPRFSEEELRVMVEEIIRVEPQLFGSQVQQTSIARKVELWRRIVDRVNAVGQHPRTRDDIRKRWNDLWGKDDQGPGVSGSGHTDQGTEAQDNREAGRTAVRQGEDRPREPTLQEALSNILGAYHHSQETMGQILAKLQETQRLQEGQYLGIRDDLTKIYTILVSIAGVLADMGKTMREVVAQQRAPDTSQTEEQPSTSASASGQEAPPLDQQDTSAPPSAEGEPPREWSL